MNARDPKRVVVIGAGAAGGACAIHLARAGCDVVVLESKSFPRSKVCGEFISPAATAVLEELLPPAELLAAGARRCQTLVIERGESKREFDMPTPAWALSRRSLDQLLADQARLAGVDVRFETSVRVVQPGTNSLAGVTLSDRSTLQADVVVHADGSGRLDSAGPVPKVAGMVGHKCHLRVPDGVRGIRMRGGNGAYVGLIAIEHGLATCALVAHRAHIARHRGDADAMLAELWPDYQAAWRQGEWMSCGVARSAYIKPGDPWSIRIGNAAAAVDPVGGEGIGLGLWSGREAAQAITSALSVAQAERRLARAYKRRLRTRRHACRLAAEVLVRPTVLGLLWPLLAAPSLSIAPWYRLSGKPSA